MEIPEIPEIQIIIPLICNHLSDKNKIRLVSTCKTLLSYRSQIKYTYNYGYTYMAVSHLPFIGNIKHINYRSTRGSKGLTDHQKKYVTDLYIEDSSLVREIPHRVDTLCIACDALPITITNNVETLYYGQNFNRTVIIPSTVKYLTFGYWYNQPTILPHGLECIRFGWCFNQPIILPDTTIRLEFDGMFNQPIILNNGIRSVQFGDCFNQNIHIPGSMCSVLFGHDFNRRVTFEPGIKSIVFGDSYNFDTILPETVVGVVFGQAFNQPIVIPNGVKALRFGDNFNQHIIIPESVVVLTFGGGFMQTPYLPYVTTLTVYNTHLKREYIPNVTELWLWLYADHEGWETCIPESAEYVIFNFNLDEPLEGKLPKNVKRVRVSRFYNHPHVPGVEYLVQ